VRDFTMSSAPAILVAQELGKTYRVFGRPWDRLLEAISGRRRHRAFEALADVSFTVGRGESLGIIGENGAGKSTLLKILSSVTVPSRGTLEVRGRVASLLELGMGFHSELTGRQNIRLNAAMMGLDAAAVEAQTPEIIAFSELGDFIDRPVKTYSSGMAMRLGFAIAVQVEPEILIIDEALSVGDGYFQKKCMDRIRVLLDRGCTFLFCSHAMYYVSTFCQRALWLRHGRIEALGPVEQVVREYESFLLHKGRRAETATPAKQELPFERAAPARLTRAEITKSGPYECGDPLEVEIVWHCTDPNLAFQVAVGIDRSDGVQVLSLSSKHDQLPALTGQRDYRVRLRIERLPLLHGAFDLYVFLLDEAGLHVYDQRYQPEALKVHAADYTIGLIATEHRFENESGALASEQPNP
jgi:ABC-type polysaccharide/polyol phosphate transport system ATPase subunit